VDAAIGSFTALDAAPDGSGGAAYQTLAAPQGNSGSDGSGTSGSSQAGGGNTYGPPLPPGYNQQQQHERGFPRPWGPPGTGRSFGFSDGSVRFINPAIDPQVLRQLQPQVTGVSGPHAAESQPGLHKPPSVSWNGLLDTVQGGLDGAGCVDQTGVCDGINALISLLRGKWSDAACSAAGMVPVIGDWAKLAKYWDNLKDVLGIADDIASAVKRFAKQKLGQQVDEYRHLYDTYVKHLEKYGEKAKDSSEVDRIRRQLEVYRKILESRGRKFGPNGELLE
jgi:hypothetical protein